MEKAGLLGHFVGPECSALPKIDYQLAERIPVGAVSIFQA
jgi:hypothetical protein